MGALALGNARRAYNRSFALSARGDRAARAATVMEPKSALSRIAATLPTSAASSGAAPREALARAVRESQFPLEAVFAAFEQAAGTADPRAVPADLGAEVEKVAATVAQRMQGGPDDPARTRAYAAQLVAGLYELWRSTWRRGMPPKQVAEIARSVLADGATSMFEPRSEAGPGGPVNPPPFQR